MENKRAVLYARVSSDDRAQEGRNLDGQLEMCRQYALDREWRIIAELAEDDRGASGAQFDLPQLNEVLELARRREFDVLVVRELDRLARSLPKQLHVESMLAKTDVTIEYVLGAYPDTPEGMFIKNVRAAIAEFERLKIAERTTRGKIQAVKAGSVLVSHKPPYGYEVYRVRDQIKLRIREDEARIVRLVFEWYGNGDEDGHTLSMSEIARKLTAMGVPTYTDTRPQHVHKTMVRAGCWNPTAIQSMLRKTEYIGQWHYRKRQRIEGRRVLRPREEQIPVEVPAIVEKGLWLAAQVRRDGPTLSRRQMGESNHLLTGHLRCGLCHSRMYGRISKRPHSTCRYYACGNKLFKAGSARCSSPYFEQQAVNQTVWAWVHSLLVDRATLDNALQEYQLSWGERSAALHGRLAQVQEQIAWHETQQETLHNLYLDQELPRAAWGARDDAFNRKLRALSHEQVSLKASLASGNLTALQQARLHELADHLLTCLHAAHATQGVIRYIFEVLKLQVVLGVEPAGSRYAQISCLFSPPTSTIPPVPLTKTLPLPAGQRKHEAGPERS